MTRWNGLLLNRWNYEDVRLAYVAVKHEVGFEDPMAMVVDFMNLFWYWQHGKTQVKDCCRKAKDSHVGVIAVYCSRCGSLLFQPRPDPEDLFSDAYDRLEVATADSYAWDMSHVPSRLLRAGDYTENEDGLVSIDSQEFWYEINNWNFGYPGSRSVRLMRFPELMATFRPVDCTVESLKDPLDGSTRRMRDLLSEHMEVPRM